MTLNPDARAMLASLDDLHCRERQAREAQDPLAALCLCLDAGNQSPEDERLTLLALADLLEERGLPAPVLSTCASGACWVWWREDAPCRPTQALLRPSVWFRLRSMMRWNFGAGWAYYRTRTAALLALARALTEDAAALAG